MIIFILAFIIAMGGGLFWANLNFVQHVPGGADFIVPWKAMRNLMMDEVSPYGETTGRQIQNLIYQRSVQPGQYPYHVNVPLHLLILYFPLSWLGDLAVARAIWMVLLEISLFGVVLFSLRLSRWKPHWLILIVLLLFSSFWQPSVSMLTTATSIMVQAFLFLAAFRSLEVDADELAGALVALSMFNIEAIGFVFLTLIVWIFSTQRWRVLGGIFMTFTVLMLLSLFLSPGWILPFVGESISNWQSGTIPSTYSIFEGWLPGIGKRLAQLVAVGALTVLFLEWRAVREQDVRWLFWTACLSAAVTPLLGLPFFSQWLGLSLSGVLLVVAVMVNRWKLLGYGSSFILLAAIFAGLWAAQLNGLTSVFYLGYPFVLTILLYWVRWGAVRRPRLWADEIMLRSSYES